MYPQPPQLQYQPPPPPEKKSNPIMIGMGIGLGIMIAICGVCSMPWIISGFNEQRRDEAAREQDRRLGPEASATMSGTGDQNTQSFTLRGGTYGVTYDIGDGYFYARLIPEGQAPGTSAVSATGPTHGTNNLYGVRAGSYHLEVRTRSTSAWAVILAARH